MSSTSQHPEPQTEEEARQLLQEAQAKVQAQLAQVGTQLDQLEQRFERDLQTVNAEIAELEALFQRLAPYEGHPAGGYHHARVRTWLESRRAYATTLEAELSCLRFNQNLARSGPNGDWDGQSNLLRKPEGSLRYLEARARLDYYLVGFLWLTHLEAVDAFLRVCDADPAIRAQDDAEETLRRENAEALKARMASDEAFQLRCAPLLEDLQVAQVLLPWARTALGRIADLEQEGKREALQDADWAKLNRTLESLKRLRALLEEEPTLLPHTTYQVSSETDQLLGDIQLPI